MFCRAIGKPTFLNIPGRINRIFSRKYDKWGRGIAVEKPGFFSAECAQERPSRDRAHAGIWENHHLWILTEYDIVSSNTDSTVTKTQSRRAVFRAVGSGNQHSQSKNFRLWCCSIKFCQRRSSIYWILLPMLPFAPTVKVGCFSVSRTSMS